MYESISIKEMYLAYITECDGCLYNVKAFNDVLIIFDTLNDDDELRRNVPEIFTEWIHEDDKFLSIKTAFDKYPEQMSILFSPVEILAMRKSGVL